jgi:hypothetical protein
MKEALKKLCSKVAPMVALLTMEKQKKKRLEAYHMVWPLF